MILQARNSLEVTFNIMRTNNYIPQRFSKNKSPGEIQFEDYAAEMEAMIRENDDIKVKQGDYKYKLVKVCSSCYVIYKLLQATFEKNLHKKEKKDIMSMTTTGFGLDKNNSMSQANMSKTIYNNFFNKFFT